MDQMTTWTIMYYAFSLMCYTVQILLSNNHTYCTNVYTLLTRKLHFSLPAEDGPKCIRRDALINSSVFRRLWVIDQ